MRHLSLSIISLSGAIIASVGGLAEQGSELKSVGLFLCCAFSLFTLVSVIRDTRFREAHSKLDSDL